LKNAPVVTVLVAELCPDQLGSLQHSPRPPSWISGGNGRTGNNRGRREERRQGEEIRKGRGKGPHLVFLQGAGELSSLRLATALTKHV